MELKEFVSEVLRGIFAGVDASKPAVRNAGGELNPEILTDESGHVVTRLTRRSISAPKALCVAEFDIALTVADKEQKGGKIGVLIGNVGIGGVAGTNMETSQVSRVKFSVPYRLP